MLNTFLRPRIPFHKASWLARDEGCRLLFASAEAAKKELESFLRGHLSLEPSTMITFVGSGRGALRLGLAALSRLDRRRKKVVVPSYCCTAVVGPIIENGLSSVFIDTGPQLVSELDQFAAAMADDVLAVLMVNLCGKRLPDSARSQVLRLCRDKGIFSIEDNCHYLAPLPSNPRPDMELHSFGFGKVLPATAGGALVARVARTELEAEVEQLGLEPVSHAVHRFKYFMAKYGGSSMPADLEQSYESARTQHRSVFMNEFDIALALTYAPRLSGSIRQHIELGKRILATLEQYPDIYSTLGADNNTFTRVPVILRDSTMFNRFWSYMNNAQVELEGMYLPLHLKFPELHNGSALSRAERLYPLVYNVPNRVTLGYLEVMKLSRMLNRFAREAA